MKNPTPLQKLKIIGTVSSTDYQAIRGIRKEINEGRATVLDWNWTGQSADFNNKYKGEIKHLMEDRNWVTFDGLFSCDLKVIDGKIVALINCSNGDTMRGNFKSSRWMAKIHIKATYLKKFEARMDYLINMKAKRMFEAEEKERAEKRIKELKKQILSGE